MYNWISFLKVKSQKVITQLNAEKQKFLNHHAIIIYTLYCAIFTLLTYSLNSNVSRVLVFEFAQKKCLRLKVRIEPSNSSRTQIKA
jgi:hypothetical protein